MITGAAGWFTLTWAAVTSSSTSEQKAEQLIALYSISRR